MRGRKYSCRKRNPLAPAEVLAINLSVEVSCELAQATSSFCVWALSQLGRGKVASLAFFPVVLQPYLSASRLASCTVRIGKERRRSHRG